MVMISAEVALEITGTIVKVIISPVDALKSDAWGNVIVEAPSANEANINPDFNISSTDKVLDWPLLVTGDKVPEVTFVLSVVHVGAELPLDFNTWPAVPAAVNVVVPAAD